MLSISQRGEFLDIRFQGKLAPKDYASIRSFLEGVPGSFFIPDSYSWRIPKEYVDQLNEVAGELAAWEVSINDIKGIREVVLPQFTVSHEGLDSMKLDPFPFQAIGISFLHDLKKGLLADEMGLGKAGSLDSKLLTPDGWITMGEVQLGDYVIGADGSPTRVVGVFPQGKKEIYRVVFSDGSSTECCEEHLWAVNTTSRKFANRPYLVKELKEFKDDLKMKSGNNKYYIPMVEPVQFRRRETIVHPYLLGYLLGNGGLTRKSCVNITIPDEETVQRLSSMIPEENVIKFKDRYDYRVVKKDDSSNAPNLFLDELRSIGVMGFHSYNKTIPYDYKFNEPDVRIALLQGLLDSDGHVRPADNNIEFSSSSEELAKDVQFIVQSLGGTARIRRKETTHLPSYRMSIILPNTIKPFVLSRKADVYHPRTKYLPTRAIVAVEHVGQKEAQCIKVEAEDQLYVTDSFIVTHNTPQAIGAAHRLFLKGLVKKTLVICPSSLKYQWQQEVDKFTDHKAMVIDGTPKQREQQLQEWASTDEYFFAVINYELVRNDIELLQSIPFDIIVCDEVHRIKNWASKTSQALKLLDAPYKFGLTGTPVQNKPEELYNIMDFIDPKILGNIWAFRKRYVVTGEKFGQRNVVIGYKRLDELRKRVAPHMLRRMKKDVAPELPEMIFNDYLVEMTPEQARLSEKLSEDMMNLMKEIQDWHQSRTPNEDEEEDKRPVHPKEGQSLGFFTMMLEVCDSPELLVLSESGMAQRYAAGLERGKIKSPKLDELVEICKDQLESGSQKIVIFTQFARMQDLIVQRLSKLGGVEILNGAMKPFERQAAVDRFKYQEDTHFFVTTDAGNYGINLQFASSLVHFDLPWNPATYDQRCGRIHRIGSAFKEVNIMNLITRGGIDERIQEVLYKKRAFSDQLVEKNNEERDVMNRLTSNVMKSLIKPKKTKK